MTGAGNSKSHIATNSRERFHFLDGLRGIAASMIVVHHAFTAHIVHFFERLHLPFLGTFFMYFTQSGVELFFVLSGVVLLRPYLRGEREFKTGDYFYRRLKRIYPPYFFALVFAAFVVWFNNQYPTWYNLKGLRVKFSWPETFKELLIFSFDGTYYNLAWWSLQIEILFYLLAPLVVFVFPRTRRLSMPKVVLGIISTIVVTYLLQMLSTEYCYRFYSYTYQLAAFGKCIEYPLCFLIGIYLASRDFNIRQAFWFMASGLLLVIAGLLLMHDVAANPNSWVYLSVLNGGYGLLYAGLIALAFNSAAFKAFLGRPIMIWLGERSYSLFLIHFSVFYLVDNVVSHFLSDRNAWYALLTRGAGIPLALFAAMLLFYFVEKKQAKGLLTGERFWPWQA
jgi:peptidoglycan/LPS O-acetylase OafA/YrhL